MPPKDNINIKRKNGKNSIDYAEMHAEKESQNLY